MNSDVASSARPQGAIESYITSVEGACNHFNNCLDRFEGVLKRLRGAGPQSPTTPPDGSKLEQVRPLTGRLSLASERFASSCGRFDNLLSELDAAL